MEKLWGYVLLALFLFLAYQSYENANRGALEEMADGLARATACDIDAACVLQSGPHVMKSDILKRQYQFKTDQGNVVVTCDRRYIWIGTWACGSERGSL